MPLKPTNQPTLRNRYEALVLHQRISLSSNDQQICFTALSRYHILFIFHMVKVINNKDVWLVIWW